MWRPLRLGAFCYVVKLQRIITLTVACSRRNSNLLLGLTGLGFCFGPLPSSSLLTGLSQYMLRPLLSGTARRLYSYSSSRLILPHRYREYNIMTANMSKKTKPLDINCGPLVWIDCEMTGLDYQNDTILEIAVRASLLIFSEMFSLVTSSTVG